MVCHGCDDDTAVGAPGLAHHVHPADDAGLGAAAPTDTSIPGHEFPAFFTHQYRYVDVYEAVHRGPFGFIKEKVVFAAIIFSGMFILRHTTEWLGFLNEFGSSLLAASRDDHVELRTTFGAILVGLMLAGARRVHIEHRRTREPAERSRVVCSPCMSALTPTSSTASSHAASRASTPTPLDCARPARPISRPGASGLDAVAPSPASALAAAAAASGLSQTTSRRSVPLVDAYQAAGIEITGLTFETSSTETSPSASPRV